MYVYIVTIRSFFIVFSQHFKCQFIFIVAVGSPSLRSWKKWHTMSVAVETTVSRVALPLPAHFSHAEQCFSIKKRRVCRSSSSTPDSSCSSPLRLSLSLAPLTPKGKGCPSANRILPHQRSPWTPLSCSLTKSPRLTSVYDPSKQQSYFNQCFTVLGLLGRGSFGEVYKVSEALNKIWM